MRLFAETAILAKINLRLVFSQYLQLAINFAIS